MRKIASLLLTSLLLTACTPKPLVRHEASPVKGRNSFTTEADLRVVTRVQRREGTHVRTITCAEPSPDIARLISETKSNSVSGGVSLPSGISAQAAYSAARGHAEGLAQLTDRLATIQILRDSMYRACEAYANEAIDETSYAFILAHSERLMFGLLTAELISGKRSPSPIVLGASSGADTAADLKIATLSTDLGKLVQGANGTLQELGGKLGRTVDGDDIGALLKDRKLAAPVHKLAEKADRQLKQITGTQQQLLDLLELPSVDLGLGGGTGGSKGGSRATSGTPVGPSAVAATAAADAAVELARLQVLGAYASQARTSPGVGALDGMQVGCITYLTQRAKIERAGTVAPKGRYPVQDSLDEQCGIALKEIFWLKRALILNTVNLDPAKKLAQ